MSHLFTNVVAPKIVEDVQWLYEDCIRMYGCVLHWSATLTLRYISLTSDIVGRDWKRLVLFSVNYSAQKKQLLEISYSQMYLVFLTISLQLIFFKTLCKRVLLADNFANHLFLEKSIIIWQQIKNTNI